MLLDDSVPSTPARWRPAVAACGLWLLRYWIAYGFHLRRAPYWQGWFDQGKYAESAFAFARGDLTAAHHWYPLAYPLLAAPFVGLFPGDPFFLVDCLLFGGVFVGFSSAIGRLGVGPWQALLVLVLTSLIVDRTAGLWIIPWTTTLSAALIWAALALSLDLLERRSGTAAAKGTPSPRLPFALGLAGGAIPLCRPTDLLPAALILLMTAALLWRRGRLMWRDVGLVSGGAAAIVLPYALLYLAMYGAAPSRYMVEAARQGFAFADLPWKAYVLLVTARPWYPDAPSIVEAMPWIVPGLAGLILLALRGPSGRAGQRAWVVIVLAAIAYSLPFLAYTDLQPSGLWRFNNAHYFKWLFPLLGAGLLAWVAALADRRRTASSLALLGVVVLPAFVRVVPRRVDDDVPARLLTFSGRTDRDWNEAYFTPSVIVDRLGTMNNVRQFHQLPDDRGVRAVAITRLFDAMPRRFDPGESPPYWLREAPVDRFAAAVEVGWPCWFVPRSCDAALGNDDK